MENSDDNTDEKDDEDCEKEINSGIELAGSCIELMSGMKMDDVEITKKLGIFVEIKDKNTNRFIY